MREEHDRRYFKWGLTALIVIFISILLVVIFTNLPGFFSLLGAIGKILSPLVSGIVIAFLLNPIVNFVDLRLRPILKKRGMKEGKADKLSRAVALVFAFIFAAFIVYAFFAMLLPQLYDSVMSIVNSAPEYYQSLEKWAVNVLEDNPEIRTYVERALDTIQSYVENWVKTSFLSDVQKILTTLTTSVMAVVKSITNFIIGLVASIYILWSKDTFQAQAKKMVVAAFKPSAANHLLDLGRNINRIFSGFIIGKIIDSAIIGVLCYICMSLMKMPYTALIATIVGVTDSEMSPINQMSSNSLLVRSEMISFVDSLAAPMSMLNALILAVANKKGADISATFSELEHIWERFDIFGKIEDE